MTTRTRLAIGLLAIAIALVVPLLFALRSLDRVHAAAAELRDREFEASLLLGRIRTGADELRRAETALLFVHDSASREHMVTVLGALSARADSLEDFALDTAAVNVRHAVADIAAEAPLEYQAALEGRAADAERISTERIVPAIARVERWAGAAERSLQQRTRERVAATAEASGSARELSAVMLLFAVLLALAIGVWLTRSISRPVRDLERGMRAIADGDFGYRLRIALDRPDEFGQLAAGFGLMAKQLAELDKLKAEFVSVASHELKTPINVMLGYLQLLREETYGPLTERQRETCATIESQAKTLARLVKQLLDVSRFEAGAGRVDPRPIELCGFFRELESAFHVLAHQRGVQFEVRCAAGLPHEVVWDPDRMNEVLGNLLSNAFKFTDRGGRVELSVESADRETLVLEVRDSGPGIPAAQIPHIFEKFYQADNQSRTEALGTGLGLAISKEIVEAHGGTIAVESTPGVGTTFAITMPARAEGRRALAARQLSLPASR